MCFWHHKKLKLLVSWVWSLEAYYHLHTLHFTLLFESICWKACYEPASPLPSPHCFVFLHAASKLVSLPLGQAHGNWIFFLQLVHALSLRGYQLWVLFFLGFGNLLHWWMDRWMDGWMGGHSLFFLTLMSVWP
jgi:hypothetical protein